MSPSEGQLRAALHEGEGDTLDAGALIERAGEIRRERRRRVYLAAGAAVVVAAVGVGVTALTSAGGQRTESAGGAAASAPAPDRPVPALSSMPRRYAISTAGGQVSAHAMRGGSVPAGCPQTAARYLLPGGGGSGQFGASEPLFTRPVETMQVCAYPVKASARVRSTVLTGTAAQSLATQLNNAPASVDPNAQHSCPGQTPAAASRGVLGSIELLVKDASGARAKPVVITANWCAPSQASNGTAVRYVATLPDGLIALLDISPTATIDNSGSPVR